MTKTELIEKIAKDTNIYKTGVSDVLDSFIENVIAELKKKDGKVTLLGFGTFTNVHRKEREGVNPKTGEPLIIKAHNTVKFKPGKHLKDAL
jgi:DNA-binding protein HU-beta